MTDLYDIEQIRLQAGNAITELLEAAKLTPGKIVLVGCSTSEIAGNQIGSSSSSHIAEIVIGEIMPRIKGAGLYLAVQCCEHLNRAIIVEEECAEKYRLETVSVVPHLKAGGALATEVFRRFKQSVVVEEISAHSGIDIGDTFIGMHLRKIAVPVRGKTKYIGHAHVTLAITRPKLIGGERSVYVKYDDQPR